MVWNFINYIQQAYETGDLSNEAKLKLALQYENKLGTRSVYLPICDKLEAYPDRNLIDKNDKAPGGMFYKSAAGHALVEECRKLLKSPAKKPNLLNHLVPIEKKKGIGKIGGIDRALISLRGLANEPQKRLRRINAFNQIWDEYAQTRDTHLFWLFKRPLEKDFDLQKLLFGLGLFHLGMRKEGEEFLLIQFKIDRCFKPSWLDADLAFYFDAACDFNNHGYTRDLRTGTRGHKEWVSLVKHVKLWDVIVLKLNKDAKLDALSKKFKTIHAKRIYRLRK